MPDPSRDVVPAISIVIATRNRLARLKQAVASARRQEGVPVEILVVDDASDDETPRWLALDAATSGLRWRRLPVPEERSRARNHGLAMARGEFVMFLDDDDELRPDAVRPLAAALRDHPSAVAAVGARWEIFEGEGYERRSAHPRWLLCRSVLREILFGWSAVSGQNLYPVATVRAVGGYRGFIPCEDRDLWGRLAVLGPVVLVPAVTVDYHYHSLQHRPPWLPFTRARVALRCLATLSPEQRARASRWVRSGRCVDNAERSISQGQYMDGFRSAIGAFALAPGLLASPLIGAWVVRRLAGRLARRFFPPRRLPEGAGKEPA